MAELGEVPRAEVWQLVMFSITPNGLHRIEFGGIARQPFDRESAPLGTDEFAHQPALDATAVRPNHQQLAGS
jgi:hypothetical protein